MGNSENPFSFRDLLAEQDARKLRYRSIGLLTPLPSDFDIHNSNIHQLLISRIREHIQMLDNFFKSIEQVPLVDRYAVYENIYSSRTELLNILVPMIDKLYKLNYKPKMIGMDQGLNDFLTKMQNQTIPNTPQEIEILGELYKVIEQYVICQDIIDNSERTMNGIIESLEGQVQGAVKKLI